MLRGMLRVEHEAGTMDVHAGQAVVAAPGEWVRYSVQANIYAPNGTVWIKSKTTATGAFIGEDVRIGQHVTLTLSSAFSK